MRIWDIAPKKLCRNHLLGEHSELHAIWSILTKNKRGYARHPETLRWKDKLKALNLKHEKIIKELKRRGYQHKSLLEKKYLSGSYKQTNFIDSYSSQIKILREKRCACKV